jgi:hypothetical protein
MNICAINNKKRYLELKMINCHNEKDERNHHGGKRVVGEINIYDKIFKELFSNKDALVSVETTEHCNFINELHKYIVDDIVKSNSYNKLVIRSKYNPGGQYGKNKYMNDRVRKVCGTSRKTMIAMNAYDSLEFMDEKGYIYENVGISTIEKSIGGENQNRLLKGVSDWVSFNWVIVRAHAQAQAEKDKKFVFRATNVNIGNISEFGAKHSILGGDDDLILAGEGAIIYEGEANKRIVQFNFNSSAFTPDVMASMVMKWNPMLSYDLAIRYSYKYYVYILKYVMTEVLKEDIDPTYKDTEVQIVDTSGLDVCQHAFNTKTFMRNGSVMDENKGILSWYNHRGCPDEEFVKEAGAYKAEHGSFYELILA